MSAPRELSTVLPGRLGDPNLTLRDDPRSDPRMIATLAPFGLDGPQPPAPVTAASPIDQIYAACAEMEAGFGAVFESLVDLDPHPDVTRSAETIKGVDGNDIQLYIHQPTSRHAERIPAIVHTHGGGMVIASADDPNYRYLRDQLAAAGMVVVGVEFRNGAGRLGNHPFPAGLNDCSSAQQWAHENRDELGISKLVMSGESGGGNLSIATTLKASREGRVGQIDGVYAQCPYISNDYESGNPNLPSLVENDGYFLSCATMGPLSRAYDPSGENDTNPLAWPLHASTEDLSGLPPHVVSVNELDPLRDEGLAYYRKLVRAGVAAVGRTVNGTCHGGDLLLYKAMPEVFRSTIEDVRAFAYSL